MKSNIPTRSRPSEVELLEWLQQKSRALGWDAWLAYDGETANDSLHRDYTERWEDHPLARPVTGSVALVQNRIWEYFYDVRFGTQQVSFSGVDLGSVYLPMSIRASMGAQLTVDLPDGSLRRVVSLCRYTPLQAPRLVFQARLDDESGLAEDARQVRMDLSTGKDYLFSVGNTWVVQDTVGAFFKARFDAMNAELRYTILNSFGSWEGGYLVPGRFCARPIAALDASESGDGAIVVLIAAKDNEAGQIPDGDAGWIFPVPEGFNASLLVSRSAVMQRLVADAVGSVSSAPEFTYGEPGGEPTLEVSEGVLEPISIEPVVSPFETVAYQVELPLVGRPQDRDRLRISLVDGALTLNWKTSSFSLIQSPTVATTGPSGISGVDTALLAKRQWTYRANSDGSVELDSSEPGSQTWVQPLYRHGALLSSVHYENFKTLSEGVAQELELRAGAVIDSIADHIGREGIDRFRSDGLLFPGGWNVRANSAHFPWDTALFGTTAPQSASFSIDPSSVRLMAGGTQKFSVSSGAGTVQWTTEALDEPGGDGGSVSSDGIYSAPAAESFSGDVRLVRVTARSGDKQASAVVSVLTRALDINPLVFVSSTTDGRTRLSAGSLDGGELNWTISSATGATLEEGVPQEGVISDAGDRNYVPGGGSSGRAFSVDEITVSNPRTGDSQAAFVMVAESPLLGVIKVDDETSVPPDQVQLVFDAGKGPIAGASWTLHVGGGSIDDNGLYTLDPSSAVPFALVTATYSDPAADLFNFMILPLPLVSLNDLRHALA